MGDFVGLGQGSPVGKSAGVETKRLDNFVRHTWFMFGAALGVALTALGGWPAGLGWLIGYGIGGFLVFGFVSGRIRRGGGEANG